MGIELFQERRTTTRKQLTGLLPGRMFVKKTGVELECTPNNVSEYGLSFRCVSIFNQDDIITLKLTNADTSTKNLDLKIIWRKEDFGKQDIYSYGLELLDKEICENLEKIFEDAGCLVEK